METRMTTFDRRAINLRALNSLTKYPSIPTYHQLDPRNGSLTDEAAPFTGQVIGTEKVDATNARIILLPPDDGGYLLGSREELLYANGDLIGNPALGIADHLRDVADSFGTSVNPGYDDLRVFYVELYGGKIGGQAKQYSTRGSVGYRLFDVATIERVSEKLTWSAERISRWRDGGGQAFADETDLSTFARLTGFEPAPRLFEVDAADLPTDIEQMHAFLVEKLPRTLVGLDDSAKGGAEGIVLRTPDRSVIAKARFQDYERTLKRRANGR
jgi:hypothetical protein